jgi:integrase
MKMKNRYRMFIRGKHTNGKVWWWCDNETGAQGSLRTTDKAEAMQMLAAKNSPEQQPEFHRQMARTHLLFADAKSIKRTWEEVMDATVNLKKGNTKARWERAVESTAFDKIRDLVVADTKADDFFAVLKDKKVSTNVFLRRLHNFALQVNWLLAPILPKDVWPEIHYKEKRAITLEEHKKIIEREKNAERRAYYEVCWQVGGSQSDMANLHAENIDWGNKTLTYHRMKTGEKAQMVIGIELEKVLRSLPQSGPLFPYLIRVRQADRATEFRQRTKGLGIEGVSLHSYRYSWAERARICGFPERFAQQALGHSSKAVHRAYSKNADVKLPSLENYETTANGKIIPLPHSAAA